MVKLFFVCISLFADVGNVVKFGVVSYVVVAVSVYSYRYLYIYHSC